MTSLRSNLIRKQLFKDDMGDAKKTNVVAPQVGPFNFGPFPPPVIQQPNVDEEAQVNNHFIGSVLNSVDSYFAHDFNMHNEEKKLKFEPSIEQQFEEYYNTLGEGYVCSPISPISQTYSEGSNIPKYLTPSPNPLINIYCPMFDNKCKEFVLPDHPPKDPNILPSSSNKHVLMDGNYESYQTSIRSPKSPKIISDYHPGYSYQYGSIEMCNAVAWEEDPDCVSTGRKPNRTRKYRCGSNCAACTYVGGQRFCNWLNGDMSKSSIEGNDATKLSDSLWAAEVPDSLEEAASKMDTVGKMDMSP